MKDVLLKMMLMLIAFIIANQEIFPYSQNSKSTLEFYKKDKIRHSVEEILHERNEYLESPQGKVNTESESLNAYETIVSDDEKMESEITIAINPLDSANILISPIKKPTNPIEGLSCPIYYTKDFGKTWEQSDFITKPMYPEALLAGGGDPVLAFDADGKAYLSWIHLFLTLNNGQPDSLFMATFWAYSADGGESWQMEGDGIVGNTLDGSKYDPNGVKFKSLFDKEWLAVDKSASQYRNNLYMSTTKISGESGQMAASIVVFVKPAGEKEFNEESVRVSDESFLQVQFSSIEVDNNGHIHLAFFGQNETSCALYHSVSTDGGKSFGPNTKISDFTGLLTQIDDETVVGVPQDRLYPCPYIAIDNSEFDNGGALYITWSSNGVKENNKTGMNVYFCKSNDGGASWSEPSMINSSEADIKQDCYYPSIAVNKNGVIVITWYDRTEDPDNLNANYYISYSFDGGDTFTAPVSLTSIPTNFSDLSASNFGIGEYNQIVTTGAYAIPVWGDGRKNNGDIDVYCAIVPITENLTSVDQVYPVFSDFRLNEPMPNPAEDFCNIDLQITKPANIRISLVNNIGERIKLVSEKYYESGDYNINIDLNGINPGAYFIVIESGANYTAKKLIIIE